MGNRRPDSVTEIPAPFVLRGLPYEGYLALRGAPANDHLRMVYHNGTLEIMSPEFIHEGPSHRFATIVLVLIEELDIPCLITGSTTFNRGSIGRKKGAGKEPDQSFYFANAERMVGKTSIDLDIDPPPDLWIEVDNRASSEGRLPLYAALGVPKVWRHDVRRGRIWFGRLVEGRYETMERGLSLPMLTPSLVLEALALGEGVLDSTWVRRLRAWVRERFLPRGE